MQPETAKRESRAEAGLDRLWVTADETVEWTEALLWDTPRDGLTSQKKWSFYHRLAPRVLAGDTEDWKHWIGTQAEYDALKERDFKTVYFIEAEETS